METNTKTEVMDNASGDDLRARTEDTVVATPDEVPIESVDPANFVLTPKDKLVFSCLMLIALFTSLVATAIGTPLPIISADLHSNSTQSIWIGTAFLITTTAAQPLFASFSQIFGRRLIAIICLSLFIIGDILCAAAQNIATILAGRVVMGAGGGGIIALTEILITDLVPLRQRGAFFGLISLAWSFGSALGPVMGGGFAQNATWRAIFYLVLPFGVISLALLPLGIRPMQRKSNILSKVKEVDYLGAFLIVASTSSFLMAISWGGILFPWTSYHTLVPIFLGVFGFGLFILWEKYNPMSPLIPLTIFTNRTSAAGYLEICIGGALLWSIVYYLPLYFEGVLGYQPVISGVALFPDTLLCAPVAIVASVSIQKIGKYRMFIWVGWLITTLGMGLMILLNESTTIPQWLFINIVGGIGNGLILPSLQFAVQAAARDEDIAYAASMVAVMRALGQGLGLPIFGAVFQSILKQKLRASASSSLRDQADSLSKNAFAAIDLIRTLPPTSADREELLFAFQRSLRGVFIVTVALAAVGLLSSVFIREISLDRVLAKTDHNKLEDRPKVEILEEGTVPAAAQEKAVNVEPHKPQNGQESQEGKLQ